MPKLKKRDGLKDTIIINFDVSMLNSLIKYIRCEYVSYVNLMNLNRLISQIDINAYMHSPDIESRLRFISALCKAVIVNNLKDENLIKTFIINEAPELNYLFEYISFEVNTLSSSECKYISNAINERLQYLYIYKVKDDIIKSLESLNENYINYYEVVSKLKKQLGELMVNLQQANATEGVIRSFNFSDEEFIRLIDLIVCKSKRPTAILQTGIRCLNGILAPGFQSGRLYVFLGGTGKFKSGTLLNIADQLRKYNPQIIPVEDGMRKTILFVTAENTIEETIVRLFDMYSDVEDDLSTTTPEDVINILRQNGEFIFTDTQGIDIDIRYFTNLEINTSNLYTIVQELADKNKKVICLILDYLKRIDSVHNHGGDERLRLSYTSQELKSLAQILEIPVITAMQINREGNSTIDAAMRENKQDVARFVGSSSVGSAWNIIEESDWVCLINPEMQLSSNQLFLTFKQLKMRGKKDPVAVDYFNHPFENGKNIKLQCDVMLERPLSIMSLSNDLQTVDDKEFERKPERPRVVSSSDTSKNNNILKSISLDGLMQSA